jgi:hypothetical protein
MSSIGEPPVSHCILAAAPAHHIRNNYELVTALSAVSSLLLRTLCDQDQGRAGRAAAPGGGRFARHSRRFEMDRKALWWAVLVIGAVMIIVPFALGMPGKTAAGQRMLNDFRPLMQATSVQKTAGYYNSVFVPLGTVATQFTAASTNPQMQAQLEPLMPMLKPVIPIFEQVPAGLAWYKPLVTTMQGNVSDYAAVDSLPNFNLFTWFFAVPGILLVLIAGAGLYTGGALHLHVHRPHPTT